MRVPDLDWPADLFTDIILPVSDAIAMQSTAASREPNLWARMVNAWTGNTTIRDSRWLVPMFDSGQIAG